MGRKIRCLVRIEERWLNACRLPINQACDNCRVIVRHVNVSLVKVRVKQGWGRRVLEKRVLYESLDDLPTDTQPTDVFCDRPLMR